MIERSRRWIFPSLTGQKRREAFQAYLFLIPWFIGLIVFLLIPIGMAAYSAFTRWILIDPPPRWIGFENFRFMFTEDKFFGWSLWITVKYMLMTLIPFMKTNPGLARSLWSLRNHAISLVERNALSIQADQSPALSFRNVGSSGSSQNLFFGKIYSKTFHVSKTPVLFPRREGQRFNTFRKCLPKKSSFPISIFLVPHHSSSISRTLPEKR